MQSLFSYCRNNMVFYAGNNGKETFYDVTRITDGTFLVCGYADDLNWIPSGVNSIQLGNTNGIPNALGTNKFGFILHLSSDLNTIMDVVYFPQGVVEDIRFMKFNTLPYQATGDLYISCNTADSDANNGGYIIAKLDHNFITGIPSSLEWKAIIWAKGYPKDYHPWDLTNDGRVFYISGESHGYDWSAIYCLNASGQRMVVNDWRTHWKIGGGEWKGTPASAYPGGGDSIAYSGIVLKSWGRCDLRSWTLGEYNQVSADGNGGTKIGKWPADILFSGPCDPNNPTTNGPGYTGYSLASCCPVYGGSSICIDKRNNDLYIGMNLKSVSSGGSPDFEPAVIAMTESGMLRWWSRLYHEITPSGDTMESLPDQYIDALSIDYSHNRLVVGARSHGNNVENLWEGNTVSADPTAYGFQNGFTGTFGNIHESWLGKLRLTDGTLTNSTYMAELFEGTGGLGTPHPDPLLDGWPDPNTGWPDLNTTYMAKNALKVSSDGSVCVIGIGRRTITTSNAYQKMVKPYWGGKSCWNNYIRMYDDQLRMPKYSSLIVGQWDTITQAGGDNTMIFGVYKTNDGLLCVGKQKADTAGQPVGNPLPVINTPSWGSNQPQNESAVIAFYTAQELNNPDDSISNSTVSLESISSSEFEVYPNPARNHLNVSSRTRHESQPVYRITELSGRVVKTGYLTDNVIHIEDLPAGIFVFELEVDSSFFKRKLTVIR